ncbi:MAG: glycosyltransferase [Candidatus Sericytochromatia bacterium]
MNLYSIEKVLLQKNYHLAINILEKKIKEDLNEVYLYLLGKSYLEIKEYQKAYNNIKKAVDINPYGIYKSEVFSITLNEIATSGNIETNRKKIILDLYDRKSVHALGFYPLADIYFLDNLDKCTNPDYFIIPNWLSPYHPVYEKINELKCPVISMIVDRLFHAEEHIKSNLIYSDIIVVMENYCIELFKKQGFSNVIYYPCAGSVAYDPLAYPKLNLEKVYDIVFLGNISDSLMYKKRRLMLDKLESLKSKYKILIKSVSNYDEYWTLTNQSKIIIDHTIDSKALNYRMFQALGIGTLCFVEENDMVLELYQDKKDLVIYNLDSLENLLEYYLNNEEERNRVSKNGQLKTINNYTHYHLLKGLLNLIDKSSFTYPSQKINNKNFNIYKGITSYYQKKYKEALDIFVELEDDSIEKENNIMVQLMKLTELNYYDYSKKINEIYNKNKDYLIITFNYSLYLKYVKKQSMNELNLNDNLKESKGLVFFPETDKKFIENFKISHGEIIFKYGINSKEYIYEFNLLLKEFSTFKINVI